MTKHRLMTVMLTVGVASAMVGGFTLKAAEPNPQDEPAKSLTTKKKK